MIEHDLPFPLYPASIDQPARLFSPEVSEHEYNIYTILPDGSLIRQDLPAYRLGKLLSTDWNELVGKY
jgi:hypothetical protein